MLNAIAAAPLVPGNERSGLFPKVRMHLISFGLLIAAGVSDLRRREVPDVLPVLLLAWGVTGVATGWSGMDRLSAVLGFLLGLGLMVIPFLMGGLGGGDVKLIAALGVVVGPWSLLTILFWMALAGAALAVVAQLRGKRDFAYVPAIIAGFLVASLTRDDLWSRWIS